MKLPTLLFIVLCGVIPIAANELDALEQSADDVSIIRYSVTVYKDKANGHDEDSWEDIVQKTTKSVRLIETEGQAIQAIADILNAAKKSSDKGIHGEVSITMSNGEKSDCCGESCKCAQMYRGNCPCSINKTSCATRSAGCQSRKDCTCVATRGECPCEGDTQCCKK